MRTIEDVLLRLKSEQVQRLGGVERAICQLLLDSLVDGKFLCVTADGLYARLTTGHYPHAVKAGLRTAERDKKAS